MPLKGPVNQKYGKRMHFLGKSGKALYLLRGNKAFAVFCLDRDAATAYNHSNARFRVIHIFPLILAAHQAEAATLRRPPRRAVSRV